MPNRPMNRVDNWGTNCKGELMLLRALIISKGANNFISLMCND